MTGPSERITITPAQCGGRPCIRNMRIRVVDVLDLRAQELTSDQILEEMPNLEYDDIIAALQYAARRSPCARCMRLRIEAPISRRGWPSSSGSRSGRVRRLGYLDATDETIFAAAREAEVVVVTKDRDFPELVERYGSSPRAI